MKLTSVDLLKMTWAEARKAKYEEGRKLHGPEWVGETRLREAYVELVDFNVYIAEAANREEISRVHASELQAGAKALADQVRRHIKREDLAK